MGGDESYPMDGVRVSHLGGWVLLKGGEAEKGRGNLHLEVGREQSWALLERLGVHLRVEGQQPQG